jgi:hypothetical protein
VGQILSRAGADRGRGRSRACVCCLVAPLLREPSTSNVYIIQGAYVSFLRQLQTFYDPAVSLVGRREAARPPRPARVDDSQGSAHLDSWVGLTAAPPKVEAIDNMRYPHDDDLAAMNAPGALHTRVRRAAHASGQRPGSEPHSRVRPARARLVELRRGGSIADAALLRQTRASG